MGLFTSKAVALVDNSVSHTGMMRLLPQVKRGNDISIGVISMGPSWTGASRRDVGR